MRADLRSTLPLPLVALLLFATAGCGDSADHGALGEIEFDSELGVNLSRMTQTDSGLYYLDEVAGEGEEARAGQGAVVHYSGWLPDGTQFDSSHGRGEPFALPLIGAGMVIEGWDEGLQGMRPGGTRLLVIPPHLAYGPAGAAGVIPPNATLVFRVEYVDHLTMEF